MPYDVKVEIWAISDPDLGKADVIMTEIFRVGNKKIPLEDIVSELCSDFIMRNFPKLEYVGHEIIEVTLTKDG